MSQSIDYGGVYLKNTGRGAIFARALDWGYQKCEYQCWRTVPGKLLEREYKTFDNSADAWKFFNRED